MLLLIDSGNGLFLNVVGRIYCRDRELNRQLAPRIQTSLLALAGFHYAWTRSIEHLCRCRRIPAWSEFVQDFQAPLLCSISSLSHSQLNSTREPGGIVSHVFLLPLITRP